MPDRRFFESMEETSLAPYAATSSRSKGRRHPEAEHVFRTAFQRDRDRVVHSTAFRRLEYKTQVFVNHEGDHYRTRLTHSLEAAQISRTMARYLRLNEDLTEAITLSHDLGHTPFGHAGEDAMNAVMSEHGGFEHNLQSLRIVDHLERRYPGFRGLNLTYEVREGILKHSPRHRERGPEELRDGTAPLLEAQLVDLADEVAYTNHDLEDGLTSGLLDLESLEEVELWRRHFGEASRAHSEEPRKIRIRVAIRGIINQLATDLIEETERAIATERVETVEDVRKAGHLVRFTSEGAGLQAELKRFLFKNLYRHYRVVRMAEKAKRVVRELFGAYVSNPGQLPPHIAARIDEDGLYRVVCDYVAGMTDRFALDEHRKLFDPLVRL